MMQSDLQSSVLWEDLTEIEARIEKTLATLQSLRRAIEEGHVGQPTRQDSKRLNRLVVLAELLFSETRSWPDDPGVTAVPGKNGHIPSTAATP
jgi:hypothetical protein